jgi:hypothetical protein
MRAIQVAVADNIVGTAPDLRSAPSIGSAGGAKPTSGPPPRSAAPDVSAPPALPAGWAVYSDAEGNAYYHCAATGDTTYTHPAQTAASAPPAAPEVSEAAAPTLTPPPLASSGSSLPAGWEAHKEEGGLTFYFNPATGESKYEHPGGTASAAPPSAQVASAALTAGAKGASGALCGAPPVAQPQARVLYSLEASSEGQLSISVGDIVTITSKKTGDWWSGVLNGQSGFFPSTYVEELELAPSLKGLGRTFSSEL